MTIAPLNPLRLLAKSVMICADIGDYIETAETNEKNNVIQTPFLNMTEYIHENHKEKLIIQAVKKHGIITRYRTFHYRNISPMRLSKPQLLHQSF